MSLSKVGMVQGMIVRDAMARPLRLTVTTEVLGGSALKVRRGREGSLSYLKEIRTGSLTSC